MLVASGVVVHEADRPTLRPSVSLSSALPRASVAACPAAAGPPQAGWSNQGTFVVSRDQRLEMQNPGVLVRWIPSEGWGTGSDPALSSARVSGTRCPCPLRTPVTLDKGTSRHPRLSLPSCAETCLPARSHQTVPGFGFSRRALEGHGASRGALCLSVCPPRIHPAPVTCGASAVCYRSGRSMSVHRVSACRPSLRPPRLSVCTRGHLSVCHTD